MGFDGKVQTPLAVPNPGTDNKLPPAGSLSYGSITSLSALSGTNGVDACLVHGDEWEHYTGTYTEFIDGDYLLTIKGNRQETIQKNDKLTIIGQTNQTHIGVHNKTNVAASNHYYAHTLTENHSKPHQVNQPTALQRFEKDVTEYFDKHWETSSWKGSLLGLSIDLTGTLKFQWASIYAQSAVIKVQALVLYHKSRALENKIQGFVTNLFLSALLASFLQAKMILADLNGGIAANGDSPFG